MSNVQQGRSPGRVHWTILGSAPLTIRASLLTSVILLMLTAFSCTKDETVAPDPVVPPAAPIVLQSSVTVMSAKTVIVTGVVKANDRATICVVEYGISASYGQRSKNIALPADTIARVVTDTITNLTSGSVMHFRLLASSPAGTATGSDTAVAMPPEMVQFEYPLTVGTVWTYAYSYSWHNKDIEYQTITGIHTWRIIFADTLKTPRVYELVAHSDDSVHYSKRVAPVGNFWDTAYASVADVPISDTVTSDSIIVRWLPTVMGSRPPDVERIPRFVDVASNTVRVKGDIGGAVKYDALYERGRGLVSYTASLGAMSGTYTLSLTLTSLVKP
jgi:hypothetical protein